MTSSDQDLEIISGFINNNTPRLADLYIKHETDMMPNKYSGTGVFLIMLDNVNKKVNMDYIPYDIVITEKLDAVILGKLKKNKPRAQCGEEDDVLVCECGICDMRPHDMFFLYCDEAAGKNYVLEANIY